MARPCVFCEAAAEASIPQGRVCRPHAIEFYTGLVAYAVDREREIVIPHLEPPGLALLPPPPRPRRPYMKRSAYWTTLRAGCFSTAPLT